jgi:hypothetical protein
VNDPVVRRARRPRALFGVVHATIPCAHFVLHYPCAMYVTTCARYAP